MRLWATLAGLGLALALTGCGSEPTSADDEPSVAESSPAAPPSLGTDAYVVRDTLVRTVQDAGGVRIAVTGRPSETSLDLVYDADRQRFARRFTWQESGETRELLQLANGHVCANLAAGRALQAAGNTGMGYVEASDRPYSCTRRDDDGLAAFLVYGYSALDPVSRLATLMGELAVTDLGTDTEDGVMTRHLQLSASESDRGLQTRATTYDLWVDADLRLTRAEFTSLDQDYGPYVAAFAYGDGPFVTRPTDAGEFVFHPGVGPGTVHPPG